MITTQEYVDRLPNDACKEAIAWSLEQQTPLACWENCERPDWMLWLLRNCKIVEPNDQRYRLAACEFVRRPKVWEQLTDDRSRNAVEVAERSARGGATVDELRAAVWVAEAWAEADVAWAAAKAAWAVAAVCDDHAAQCNIIRKHFTGDFKAWLEEGE